MTDLVKQAITIRIIHGALESTSAASRNLEAFSGNALYCGRGMPRMKNYKTVKEVCALTGLTGKHLYYFHHEKVVRATAFSNYSVAGYDGYKLYDDEAVEKLQQIALYYELGLKRNEIKDIMLDPNYDSNAVLGSLLAQQLEKRAHIDRLIAAIEHLQMFGTKNHTVSLIKDVTLDELGQRILDFSGSRFDQIISETLCDSNTSEFDDYLSHQLKLLHALSVEEITGEPGGKIIDDIFQKAIKQLGFSGYLLIYGVFLGHLGHGSIVNEINGPISEHISSICGKCAMNYLDNNIRRFFRDAKVILSASRNVVGMPYDSPDAMRLVAEIKELLHKYFGIGCAADYEIIFGTLHAEQYIVRNSTLKYLLNAIKNSYANVH